MKPLQNGMLLTLMAGVSIVPTVAAAAQGTPPPGAQAQASSTPSGQTDADDSGLGEIVVTAQRREQSLQDTPVSVTAISEDTLRTRGVQTANDLVGLVPGFSLRDAGTSVSFNVRGYITTDPRPASDSPIAVYIDDVFLGSVLMQQMQNLDVARVEALRGPQGTLFGRNAVGGLIHFVSNKPTDTLDGYARLQVGMYKQTIAEAAVGGPINDAIAMRVAVKWDRDDGWQRNGLGGPNLNARNAFSGRVQLRARLSDTLEANFSYQGDRERNRYQGLTSLGALNSAGTSVCSYDQIVASQCFLGGAPFSNVPAGTQSLATYGSRTVYSTLRDNIQRYEAHLALARLDWDVGANARLSSITSWGRVSNFYNEDDNSTGLPANNPFNILRHDYGAKQFSQELRLSGKTAGSIDYVAGLYYLNSTKDVFYGTLDSAGANVIAYNQPRDRVKTRTAAAFAQVEIPLAPTFRVIAGGRYTWEEKNLERTIQAGLGTLGPVQRLPDSSDSLNRVIGKGGVQWTPTANATLYATVSNGFKSGEYPSDASPAPLQPVRPESIVSFEVGSKNELFDRRLRVNIAGYINTISDKQSAASIRDAVTGVARPSLVNFGDVKQKGVEVEVTAKPVPAVTIGANFTYVDNVIRAGRDVTVQRLAFFNTFSLDGNELPGAPPYQASATADWELPLRIDGKLALGGTVRWQSKTYWNISNNEIEIQPAYGVGDLRLNYTSAGGNWTLGAFVNNVTDKRYSIVNFSFGGSDVLTVQWGRPRWAGIRAGVNF